MMKKKLWSRDKESSRRRHRVLSFIVKYKTGAAEKKCSPFFKKSIDAYTFVYPSTYNYPHSSQQHKSSAVL